MGSKSNIKKTGPQEFFPSALSGADRDRIRQIVVETANSGNEVRASSFRAASETAVAVEADEDRTERLRFAVACSILADLSEQGWKLETNDHHVLVEAASFDPMDGETIDHAKRRIRMGLQMASNRQLAQDSVREFLRNMEREREFKGRQVSITTLIDDGKELSREISEALQNAIDSPAEALGRIIRPVVQECASDERCKYTGLRLQDVWRYFRYTWSLEYNPLPGRTQRFLIRNAARKSRPVIGIAMLASPTANLASRDNWIGWQIDQVCHSLMEGSVEPRLVARRLYNSLKEAVAEIRSDDLLALDDLENPSFETVLKLERIAAQAAAQRRIDLEGEQQSHLVDIRNVDKESLTDEGWFELSNTALFKKKRAEQLVPLLRAIETLQGYGIRREPVTAIYRALVEKPGQEAIRVALNEIKKRRLATEVADLAVCGAVAPYNALLGGKLVALAMSSREARNLYKKRYGDQVSEIASQIAGKAVVRSSDLKLITTTSLYGVGGNQYSGLALRQSKFPELASDVIWKKLRSGSGVSITHVSDLTVDLMRQLGIAVYGRRRINSVFGEGSSPRMRQVREGLNLIGINDDSLLKQSHGRKVYGCELFNGARDEMLGFSRRTRNRTSSSIRQISIGWIERYLTPWVRREGKLEALAKRSKDEIEIDLKGRIAEGDRTSFQPSKNGASARSSTASISAASNGLTSSELDSADLIDSSTT